MNRSSTALSPFLEDFPQRGAVSLELIVVWSVIVLLVFGSVELSSLFKQHQLKEFLARESAKAVFHKCRDAQAPYGIDRRDFFQACLKDSIYELDRYCSGQLEDYRLIVTYFEQSSGLGPGVRRIARWIGEPPNSSLSYFSSRFSEQRIAGEYSAALEATGALIVAEVYVPTRRLTNFTGISKTAKDILYGVSLL